MLEKQGEDGGGGDLGYAEGKAKDFPMSNSTQTPLVTMRDLTWIEKHGQKAALVGGGVCTVLFLFSWLFWLLLTRR